MRDARLPKAPSQNGGVNGVLCRRAFGEFVQQAPCISLSTLVEQYFDPRIRNIGHCGFRPYVAKSDDDGLRRLRIVPLGAEPNHFRREHYRGRIRMPSILDSLERIVAPAHCAEVRGVLNRRYCRVLWMRRQRRSKPSSVRVEIETRRRRAVLRHRPVDSWKPGPQCLGQSELIQELADATIPSRWRRNRRIGREMMRLNAGDRPRIADNLHAIGVQEHLARLHHIGPITAVMDGVSHRTRNAQRRSSVAVSRFRLRSSWNRPLE